MNTCANLSFTVPHTRALYAALTIAVDWGINVFQPTLVVATVRNTHVAVA